MIRQALEEGIVSALGKRRDVALAYSAGIDISCILFSLLSMGYNTTLYTYRLDGHESDDAKWAGKVAGALGLTLRPCTVPTDRQSLLRDLFRLIRLGRVGNLVRRKGRQQIVAGTRALHDTLLSSPVNERGSKGVVGIYKGLAKKSALALAYMERELLDA